MLLTLIGEVFVLRTTYEEREAPKLAGFFWHGGKCKETPEYLRKYPCRACAANIGFNVWWTPDKSRAVRLVNHADDAAKAALASTVTSLEASRATDADIKILLPEGRELLAYQRAGIAFCNLHQSVLIGDEPGLGKTIQASATINADPFARRVLIVCPASIRDNWERECKRWLARPMGIHVRELGEEGIAILSFEDVKKHWEAAMAVAWDLIIVDEAHFLKNSDSQRSRMILGTDDRRAPYAHHDGIADKARRKLFLTGTPLPNRPIELWPLLHCLAPKQFPSFMGFAKRYAGAYKDEYAWNFDGATNLEELQQAMRATCMVRRKKRDVLKELPPKRRQIVVLEPTAKARKLIKLESEQWDKSEAHAAELEEQANAEFAATGKVLKAASVDFGEIARVRHELAFEKVPQAIDFVEGLLEEGIQKVIVFGHHKDVVGGMAEGLKKYGVVTLTGETPMNMRQVHVDSFQNDDNIRVFIGSITAAGVGLTLTASSTVVFIEESWVPAEVTQGEDRAHRIGQQDSVNVYHLVYDGSLDGRMIHILIQKQEVADKALDRQVTNIQVAAEVKKPVKPQGRPVDPALRYALREAIRYLAYRCDGAKAKDGCGFNANDAFVGKKLAQKECLTDNMVVLVSSILRKYKRQLKKGLPPEQFEVLMNQTSWQ